ncbi:MAG: hypothetical protein WD805_03960 [Gaiellaceae bacterium]
MGSSNQRMLAAAALVLAMSAIVGLVVLSPLAWRDGPSPGPAPQALPSQGEIAEVVAREPELEETAEAPPTRAGQARPLQACRGDACVALIAAAPPGQARPLQKSPAATPPAVAVDRKGKGKDKGHEKKGLGSKKAGKHGDHAQGAPGKGHGKGKSKDRDRAPARARG